MCLSWARHVSHLFQLGETCVSPFSIPGSNTDDGEFGSVEEDGDEDAGRPPTKRRRTPRQLSRQFTD